MARQVGKLAPNAASKITKPGRYADGGGLYLVVSRSEAKSWGFRYMRGGKAHELGLGPTHAFSLAEARERARKLRQQLADGADPLAAKREARREAAPKMTFAAVAELYIKAHEAGWRSPVHAKQWRNSLRDHVLPLLGEMAVDAIAIGDVMRVLEPPPPAQPFWRAMPETASRARQRIEAILDYAKARGWRDGDNPARWKGHLDNLLPKPSAVRKVEHHAAMRWQDVPGFVAGLAGRDGIAARALRFVILTGARSGEVRGARWSEIDLHNGVWTVPGTRMKGAKEHRVPLSDAALEMLHLVPRGEGDALVFPGAAKGKPLSDVALAKLVPSGATVHGFRSSFRTWGGETTNYAREVIEMALAHRIGDAVEQAYSRGDLFQRRTRLMADWANYCSGKEAERGVAVPLRA